MTNAQTEITSAEMREICTAAINGALVSRGKYKGSLKRQCPKTGSDAAAAWQAIMGHANPYKISIGQIIFFNERQNAIYKAIDSALEGRDGRKYDRDRVALEIMGAW